MTETLKDVVLVLKGTIVVFDYDEFRVLEVLSEVDFRRFDVSQSLYQLIPIIYNIGNFGTLPNSGGVLSQFFI